ncbi:peptidyl-prolyl cis-trans isomerase [Corallincola holothuriorum]|uniref:Peptidyl-prolyl cis-trans isomerase n=1 Tax=Corallincola holothuriorum TaxID=2282215 RepID=A0A368NS36_9GAMM|nr:peptidyl-prolyl cis-trans isomerase [Corallincola holothuriorum]RCU52635.1 peptidyl-prolyl cis-trans isomerase [Corallincola holothuriorum]
MLPIKQFGLCLLIGSCLSACSEPEENTAVSHQAPESPVLVMVNGETITEQDVEFAINKTFSDAELMMADEGLRQKVLESLVASRAMRHAASLELTMEAREYIAQRVAAYEEELYVREYLRLHTTPQPVTNAMVESYYQQHPEYFGADEVVDLELLTVSATAPDSDKQWLLANVASVKANANWAASGDEWRARAVQHSEQRVEVSKLSAKLRPVVSGLGVADVSDVVVEQGQLQLVRVKARQSIPPRPLAEVSADIRKRLAPLNVKRAVKEASEKAAQTATIEWVTPRS